MQQMRSPGEKVGPYEIVRVLGAGGMGRVYVAHAADGELVAVKLMENAKGDAELVRFSREADIARTLEHPHIVAGRGAGLADDGTPFLALELLSGIDLGHRIERGDLRAADAIEIALQICDALVYAHSRGIVHRDLKPSNVFVCAGDRLHVKILDFGIARTIGDQHVTATGTIVGTVAYMSPEQARGARDVDARVDVWSLGVLLYEMLSGRLPFANDSAPATLFSILFTTPPDLFELRPGIPRALADIVSRALQKSRDDRFPTMEAMRLALSTIDRAALDLPPPRARLVDANAETQSDASTAAIDAERRLTSIVYLQQVRDASACTARAIELSGRPENVRDDMIVVFGIDRWSGDEPWRAVRFALAVREHVGSAGVATGRIVRRAESVAGATVSHALELSAENGVWVDATTADLVRDRFELSPRERGGASLVVAEDELRTAPREQLTPFVGREAELSMLLRAIDTANAERSAQAAIVIGASGIGKTRLRREALDALERRDPIRVLVARCDAFRRDTPFAALETALGGVIDASRVTAFRPGPAERGDPLAALDRARLALLDALEELSASSALLLVLEDAQWIDASSRATIRWIFDNAPELPLAVWIFARPEARAAVLDMAPAPTVLELGQLGRAAASELLSAIVGSAPEVVLDRAAGHPLFLEELGRLVRDRGIVALTNASMLPVSVEGVLLGQLDALEHAERELLKRAAIFGQIWWLEATAALGADPSALDRLRRANLVAPRPRSRFPGARELAFRTGLLRDVAYGLWPEEERARLHGAAATWLEGRESAAPDELALHWDLAGQTERAAREYVRAAEAASKIADFRTTSAHAARVLALTDDPMLRWRARVAEDDVATTSASIDTRRLIVGDLVALAESLPIAQRAEAAWRECQLARLAEEPARARSAGERAIAFAVEANDSHAETMAHREMAMLLADETGDEAPRHAEAARALAEKSGDEWLVALSLSAIAYVGIARGLRAGSIALLEDAARRFAKVGDRRRESAMRGNAGDILIELGRLKEASEQISAAIESSEQFGHQRALAVGLHNLGLVRRLEGDVERAHSLQTRAMELAERLTFKRLVAAIAIELAYLALDAGHGAESAAQRARETADECGVGSVIASARAVSVRVSPSEEGLAELHATVPSSPLLRLEIASAMGDDAAIQTALDEASSAAPADDRENARSALARRYLVRSTR